MRSRATETQIIAIDDAQRQLLGEHDILSPRRSANVPAIDELGHHVAVPKPLSDEAESEDVNDVPNSI